MIERHLRLHYPEIDTTLIEKIRVSSKPDVREAIFWEYGIDALLPFIGDPETIDEEISSFIRLRGTLSSIRMALRWVGFPKITFNRLSWYQYEIDPGRVPTEREILAIRAALSVSVQARGQLMRIFHGSFEVKYV
jgi:hypothetical protein